MMSRPANVGPGDGELVLGVLERDDPAGSAEHRDRRREQPVVGTDEEPAFDLDRDAPPLGADARIDDCEHHAVGQVLHRPHERERPGAHVERGDVVGDVDDPQIGGTSSITAWHTPTNSSTRP